MPFFHDDLYHHDDSDDHDNYGADGADALMISDLGEFPCIFEFLAAHFQIPRAEQF